MNHKITYAAGLIFACMALFQLRAAGPDTPDVLRPQTGISGLPQSTDGDSWIELQNIGSKNLTVAIEMPEVYMICCRTNRVVHHGSTGPAFPFELNDTSGDDWPENAVIRGAGSASGFRLLPGAGQPFEPDAVDARPVNKVVPEISPEISLFENFTGNDIFDWLYEPLITNTPSAKKSGSKKKSQTVVIAPDFGTETQTVKFPSYAECFVPQKHAWYGWISPELILTQWAQYWFEEVPKENTKTIVLMRLSF